MNKANYGIDAPKVIRTLFLLGTVSMFVAALLSSGKFPAITNLKYSFLSTAIGLILSALLMVLYSKFGKTKHRDRMLNMYEWKGDENVLDVGTGSGLLMIGAAKHLITGKSYGIDIFNSYDLSDNTIAHTKLNTRIEGVEDKTKILSENILKTNFSDEFFDVIISNLCLHNIYNKNERNQACREIFRLLKPGGVAIISDFKHNGEYQKVFEQLGMKVEKKGPYFLSTFPPLTITRATKSMK